VVRCPNGGIRHLLHARLVGVIKTILREAGVPDAALVTEARGLRAADRLRPGDVVALDFFADGRHLVIDAVMTTVYKNTVLEKVATVPGIRGKTSRRLEVFGSQDIKPANLGGERRPPHLGPFRYRRRRPPGGTCPSSPTIPSNSRAHQG